jgi:hypothetical protein
MVKHTGHYSDESTVNSELDLQINQILTLDETEIDLTKLTKAVNILDKSSAMFAPHERQTSSRHRLVNEVRRQHKLKS